MKHLLSLAAILLTCVLTMHASVVTYEADNTTIFRNPERGFTDEWSRKVSLKNPNVIKGSISSNWGTKYCMTMPVVLYNFGNFKSADLPDDILAAFDEDMQLLRDHGLKCVLRFAYTESEKDNVDATPEWVQRHLEQLASHLALNADVIYVLEAGFIGVWGEWYYTKNYGNESMLMNDKRRLVIDYLFANTPKDLFILFRYPLIKTGYLSDAIPLTAEEGFSGSLRARMGCHNDAFMNTYGDMGTYASADRSDDPAMRQYIATETLYVPNGGETNIEEDNLAEKRYTRAPGEMSTYHWSFCGSSYATQVTQRWRESGLFDTLNIHMGYRYNLLDGQFTDEAAPAGKMNVTIRVRNSGYAPIYNERKAYIVLKSADRSYSLPVKADPRRWLPNYAVSSINEQLQLPADIAEGTYRLYLYLPDIHSTIADDPRYAVRMANTNVWDEETGMNDLGATIVISATAPADPGELPDVSDALPTTAQDAGRQPQKILENGILYIAMPDGTRYTTNGQITK